MSFEIWKKNIREPYGNVKGAYAGIILWRWKSSWLYIIDFFGLFDAPVAYFFFFFYLHRTTEGGPMEVNVLFDVLGFTFVKTCKRMINWCLLTCSQENVCGAWHDSRLLYIGGCQGVAMGLWRCCRWLLNPVSSSIWYSEIWHTIWGIIY